MTGDPGNVSFQEFLGAALRRLWLLELFDALRIGLWASAAMMLLLAAAHTLVAAIPESLIWLVIAAIIGWILLRTAIRRPALNNAATKLDRCFAARSLLSTAVECLQQPEKTDRTASTLVSEQAGRAAKTWHRNIREAIVSPEHIASAIALIPLFIAILLLTQPGASDKERSNPASSDAVQSTPGTASVSEAIDEDDKSTSAVANLRRELADSDERIRTTPADNTRSDMTNPARTSEALKDTLRGEFTGDSASAGSNADSAAGDAAANRIATESIAGKELTQTTSIAIRRTGQQAAATIATGRQYKGEAAFTPYSTVNIMPAAPPESGPDRSTLTAAQAAYASRYLSATGENDD